MVRNDAQGLAWQGAGHGRAGRSLWELRVALGTSVQNSTASSAHTARCRKQCSGPHLPHPRRPEEPASSDVVPPDGPAASAAAATAAAAAAAAAGSSRDSGRRPAAGGGRKGEAGPGVHM